MSVLMQCPESSVPALVVLVARGDWIWLMPFVGSLCLVVVSSFEVCSCVIVGLSPMGFCARISSRLSHGKGCATEYRV
ncbi:uncharacterized protein BO97DRAFT_215636 [Aspergillus homomorphus CBS 101889]|uniref:Uncharacterized protein n=1 Tax=Aspergillus homomorphus (strain CBS 101889) TaxID=1450537 RepID=A0A395I5N2_ASPHC|nr:hypothetical protein BO97DRAFT_215636 [Aspergillus homomorphus CBS 101889]RAL15542.1 hypothetical protein BO97DRAFT_215636 [Aspergillus homomorphus CBS 101889]